MYMQSQPSLSSDSASTDSTSVDSTKSGSKIFEKKVPKSSKKQNLNLPHTSNYLYSIYIILGIISNLEMIQSKQEDVGRLYANTKTFYVKDLSILRFQYPRGSWDQSPVGLVRLYKDFSLCRGLAPLTSCVVQGSTVCIYLSHLFYPFIC